MTPAEKAKQESLADKLRKVDPFTVDRGMVKDPDKLRDKNDKTFPTIKADSGESYGTT